MRVIVACEYSGIVSAAFAAKGHDVTSCDLLPTELVVRSNVERFRHIKGDVLALLRDESFDLMIGFPPCTFLCQAPMHRKSPGDQVKTAQAYNFFLQLFYSRVKRIGLENPIGWLNTNFRAPDQITSPHKFGSPYRKAFCLWLKNLPPLMEGAMSAGSKSVNNHTNSRMTQEERSKIRSRFFPEVAEAMAEQWTEKYLFNKLW